jgi:hypothetical protein
MDNGCWPATISVPGVSARSFRRANASVENSGRAEVFGRARLLPSWESPETLARREPRPPGRQSQKARISTEQRANTSIHTCIRYFAKSWLPHQARPIKIGFGGEKIPTPSANCRLPMIKMCIFLEELDPFRQFSLAGGGGWRGEKKLDSCVLLALRQFPRLAGRHGRLAVARRGCIPRYALVRVCV